MNIKRNMYSQNGTFFVGQKNLEVWESKIWVLKINAFWANGCLNLMTKMAFDKALLKGSTLYNKTLTQLKNQMGDSKFWSGLMKMKDQFLACDYSHVSDGSQTWFREDKWISEKPFSVVYPALHKILRRKYAIILYNLSSIPLNVSFRRALVGSNLKY